LYYCTTTKMIKIVFALIVAFLSLSNCQSPNVRFVNAIEGSTIDIYTNELNTVHLTYEQVTDYVSVPAGSIHVTNVLDQNSNSLNNAVPILIQFDYYATVVAVIADGNFVLVLLNETVSTGMSDADPSKAYVRMIDLGNATRYTTIASASGSLSTYVGFLEATPFVAIDKSTSDLVVFDSQAGTYNDPILTIPTSFNGGSAYTVFFFTPTSGANAVVQLDRTLPTTSPVTSTPSSSTGTESNSAETTFGVGVVALIVVTLFTL